MTLLLIVVLIACSLLMLVAWRVQQGSGNSSWVDVAWTFGTGLARHRAGALPASSPDGLSARQIAVSVDRGRMGAAARHPHHAPCAAWQGRPALCQASARAWGESYGWKMPGFPPAPGAQRLRPRLLHPAGRAEPGAGLSATLDILALVVAVVSIGGEALSDEQVHRFASNPANKGKICEDGLWGWSRHPELLLRMAHLGRLCAVCRSPDSIGAGAGSPGSVPSSCTAFSSTPPAFRQLRNTCCNPEATPSETISSRVSKFLPLPPKGARRVSRLATIAAATAERWPIPDRLSRAGIAMHGRTDAPEALRRAATPMRVSRRCDGRLPDRPAHRRRQCAALRGAGGLLRHGPRARTANTPAASTRPAVKRWPKPRLLALTETVGPRRSRRGAGCAGTRLRLGIAHAVHGGALSRKSRITAVSNSSRRSARYIEA